MVFGVASAEMPNTISRVEQTLQEIDVEKEIDRLLVAAIVEQGNKLTSFKFVALEQNADKSDEDRDQDSSTRTTTVENSFVLVVKPTEVGIQQGAADETLILNVEGRFREKNFAKIHYVSKPNKIAAWLSRDSALIRSTLKDAAAYVAKELIIDVFKGDHDT